MSSMPKETAKLRAVMASDTPKRFWWTSHGRQEMRRDEILESDVQRVCRNGTVTWVEWKKDEIWHVEGRDIDGRSIRVIMILIEEDGQNILKIVTAMAL